MKYSGFVKCLRKLRIKWTIAVAVYSISFKKPDHLCNIRTEYAIPKDLTVLSKMCLNKRRNQFRISKLLSHTFHNLNCLKRGDALSPLL